MDLGDVVYRDEEDDREDGDLGGVVLAFAILYAQSPCVREALAREVLFFLQEFGCVVLHCVCVAGFFSVQFRKTSTIGRKQLLIEHTA